jgi:hypothetical protein
MTAADIMKEPQWRAAAKRAWGLDLDAHEQGQRDCAANAVDDARINCPSYAGGVLYARSLHRA